MKRRLSLIVLILLLTVALLLSFGIFNGQLFSTRNKGDEPTKTDVTTAHKEPTNSAEKTEETLSTEEALLVSLTAGKDSQKMLSDLSAFTSKKYGLIDLGYVLLFEAENYHATLSFAGTVDETVSGKFSATETMLTIGEKSYLYAFFNSYLLLKSEHGMHILYPEDRVDFEAAYALLKVTQSKTNGASLTFRSGKASISVPNYSASDAIFRFDKNNIIITKNNGENIALGKKVTSSSNEGGGNVLENVNDGNNATRWSSGYSDNQFITVDFGASYTVGAVRIYWEAAAAKDFEIRLSADGANWVTVYEEENNTVADTWADYHFDAKEARYMQIKCGKRLTSYGISMYEIEAYASYVAPYRFTYGIENGEVYLTDGTHTYRFESEALQ